MLYFTLISRVARRVSILIDSKFHLLLIGTLLSTSLYFFVVIGTTFWADSILYIDMANHWFFGSGLGGFYTPIIKCIAPHFPPMPAIIWSIGRSIDTNYAWLFYVLIQRFIVVVSLYYFITSLARYFNKTSLLISTAIVGIFPFFQSIQNMVMSEAMTASFVLIIFGAAINLMKSDKNIRYKHISFMVLGIIFGSLARPQIALYGFFIGLWILLVLRDLRLFLLISLSTLLSYFFFPVYRYIVTGDYFLPNVSCLAVRSAQIINLNTGNTSTQLLKNSILPRFSENRFNNTELSTYDELLSDYNFLLANGYSRKSADSYLLNLSRTVRFSSSDSILKQLLSSLTSIGMIYPSYILYGDRVFMEGMGGREWSNHFMNHYRWLSGTSPDNYKLEFLNFIQMFKDQNYYLEQSIDDMTISHLNYINIRTPLKLFLIDPILISNVKPDLWSLIFIISLYSMYFYKKQLAILIAGAGFVNFTTILMLGFGNIRYFYPIMPIIIIFDVLISIELISLIFNKIYFVINK